MIKKFLLLAALVLGVCACTADYGYKIKGGRIVYNTPPRPADQQSMLGFACDPIASSSANAGERKPSTCFKL